MIADIFGWNLNNCLILLVVQRSLPRSDGYNRRRSHSKVPETAKPTYFPQIFTTWSHEDLEIFDSLKKSNNASKPLYPRSTPKSHIRVNRHIHDFETPKQRHLEKGKAKSDETDHIYESLDEVSSNKRNQKSKSESYGITRYLFT